MFSTKPANSLIFSGLILLTTAVFGLSAQEISPDDGRARHSNHAAQVRQLNNELLRLHGEMQQISPDHWEALREQAAPVLAQRFAALGELIQRNPSEALKHAFSPDLIDELAAKFPQFASQLEKHGTWQGPVERWILDYADLKSSREVLMMKVGQQTFEVHFAEHEPAGLKSGDVLEVTGVQVGQALVASSGTIHGSTLAPEMERPMHPTNHRFSTMATTSTTSPATCSTTGVQNTAVLLVTWPGAPAFPSGVTTQSSTDTFFSNTAASLNTEWKEASYGQTSATGTVYGPLTLSQSYTCSTMGDAQTEALAQVAATGVDVTQYTRIFVVQPSIGCVAGFSSVGCSTATAPSGPFPASHSFIDANYAYGSRGIGVITHEAGHQLGLLHAHSINAYPDVVGPIGSPGASSEVGDLFSPMGSTNVSLYNAPEQVALGWTTSPTNYQVVTSSGTYTLQPLESSPAGLETLKVQRGTGNNAWLWIEYRQPIGYSDAQLYSQVYSGAFVHYEDASTEAGTNMLNYTPSATLAPVYPALAAGQTWSDPYTNLSISVQSATAAALTVNINYGAVPCTHANPTVTVTPPNPTTVPGLFVNYGVTVTNNDAAGCAASTFNLTSSQPLGWSGTLSPTAIALNPGQTSGAVLTETTPASASQGTYALSASAINGTFAGTGTANCTLATTTPLTGSLSVPSSSYKLRQTVSLTSTVMKGGTPAAGATVSFTLTKANGNRANGKATTDATGTASWSYRLGPKDPTGSYSAVALASSGSQIATSNTATFTVQ